MTGWLRQAWVVVRVRFGGPRPAPGPHIPDTVPADWANDTDVPPVDWDRAQEWADIHEVVEAVAHFTVRADRWQVFDGYRKSNHPDMAEIAARAIWFYSRAEAAVGEVVAENPELTRLEGEW